MSDKSTTQKLANAFGISPQAALLLFFQVRPGVACLKEMEPRLSYYKAVERLVGEWLALHPKKENPR